MLKYAIKATFETDKLIKKLKAANRGGLKKAGYAIMNRAKKSIINGGAVRFRFKKQTKLNVAEKKKYYRELALWRKNGRHGPRPKPNRSLLRGLEKTSRPGQPPVSHIGHLKKSIAFNIDVDATSMIVGPQIHRSKKGKDVLKALEEGGISRNAWGIAKKIAARPFMKPALEKERGKISGYWKDALNKSI